MSPRERPAERPLSSLGTDSTPDVSVIIPVHNTAEYLPECLAGVRRQSGCSLEIICVDDGSTDGSGDVLDAAGAGDHRIRLVHQANAGPSAARNAGLALASGRYVCFVDSDDYWQSDELSQLVRQADDSQLDVLLFDAVTLREEGIGDRLWARYQAYYTRQAYDGIRSGTELMAAMNAAGEHRASPCLYLMRRALLTEHALGFHPGIIHEDNLFTFALLLHASRARHTQTALYARRLRPGSIVTAKPNPTSARGLFVVCVEMFRLLSGRKFDDAGVSAQLADIVYTAYRLARNSVVAQPVEVLDHLGDAAQGPDAEAILLLLRASWREKREQQLLVKRLKQAARTHPFWRRHPFLLRARSKLRRLSPKQ